MSIRLRNGTVRLSKLNMNLHNFAPPHYEHCQGGG